MLKKIPFTTIEPILTRYQLSDEAKAVLTPNMQVEQAITVLSQQKLLSDAIQLIAHGLGVIEAIFWGCKCLALREEQWDKNQVLAINSALKWLQTPNETLRIRADQLAERIGLESGPAWLAKSVYWSGTGSIVAPELPAVMPPPFLYAHAIASAITIAAAVPQWQENDIGYEKFFQHGITLGLNIANGEKIQINLLTESKEH